VPGLFQLGRVMPHTVEIVVGGQASNRLRSAGVACCTALIALWTVLPVM